MSPTGIKKKHNAAKNNICTTQSEHDQCLNHRPKPSQKTVNPSTGVSMLKSETTPWLSENEPNLSYHPKGSTTERRMEKLERRVIALENFNVELDERMRTEEKSAELWAWWWIDWKEPLCGLWRMWKAAQPKHEKRQITLKEDHPMEPRQQQDEWKNSGWQTLNTQAAGENG